MHSKQTYLWWPSCWVALDRPVGPRTVHALKVQIPILGSTLPPLMGPVPMPWQQRRPYKLQRSGGAQGCQVEIQTRSCPMYPNSNRLWLQSRRGFCTPRKTTRAMALIPICTGLCSSTEDVCESCQHCKTTASLEGEEEDVQTSIRGLCAVSAPKALEMFLRSL